METTYLNTIMNKKQLYTAPVAEVLVVQTEGMIMRLSSGAQINVVDEVDFGDFAFPVF